MLEIIHIEPDPAIRQYVRELLECDHIRLMHTPHIAGAMDAILCQPPQLVISNYRILDQTVLHLKTRFKMLHWDIPILVLSKTPLPSAEIKSLQRLGIEYFHTLNDHPGSIRQSINQLLGVEILPAIMLMPKRKKEAEAPLPC